MLTIGKTNRKNSVISPRAIPGTAGIREGLRKVFVAAQTAMGLSVQTWGEERDKRSGWRKCVGQGVEKGKSKAAQGCERNNLAEVNQPEGSRETGHKGSSAHRVKL